MATPDLDRHLKAGRQTIAVLAGGAAILTAGHDGKIGLPIAVTIALISAFWGILTVIDANYWSLRVIAFLANVEAVYFSAQDRAYFNRYIGHHPTPQIDQLAIFGSASRSAMRPPELTLGNLLGLSDRDSDLVHPVFGRHLGAGFG